MVILHKFTQRRLLFHCFPLFVQLIEYVCLPCVLFFIEGYANEVGEALRPVIPKKVVHLSYGVAITYVICDCFDKTIKTYQVNNAQIEYIPVE